VRSRLRRRRLAGRLPLYPVTLGLPPGAVRLGVLYRGGVALRGNAERPTQIERFLVGNAQLASELVDADFLRHLVVGSFFLAMSVDEPVAGSSAGMA
jgi:hypothetical protein